MQVSNGESGASAIPEIKKKKKRKGVSLTMAEIRGWITDPHDVWKPNTKNRARRDSGPEPGESSEVISQQKQKIECSVLLIL